MAAAHTGTVAPWARRPLRLRPRPRSPPRYPDDRRPTTRNEPTKTLASACKPRDSIFDAARRDTVVDLSDLVQDRIDPEAFFRENHVTEGMRILLTEGFRRLEGKTTQEVFKLTQAMGCGKTHNLWRLACSPPTSPTPTSNSPPMPRRSGS
jgi:hypothetical protein